MWLGLRLVRRRCRFLLVRMSSVGIGRLGLRVGRGLVLRVALTLVLNRLCVVCALFCRGFLMVWRVCCCG